MKIAKLIVTCLIMVSFLDHVAYAQRFKLPFAKTRTEQSQEISDLTQRSGPWLVMCASFVGEEGRQQANRLAQELREKHRLTCYVYSHEFDFADEVASKGLGWEVVNLGGEKRTLRPKQMKPAGEAQFEEIAVLVGDFSSIEDARAQRTLAPIKTLRPESMANYDVREAVNDDSLAGSRLRAWREFSLLKSNDPEDKLKGPLKAAFLMPNPMLPDEYFEARKVDHAVIKWNRDTKYSLLDNSSMYTVKIASFRGDSTFELAEIEKNKAEDAWLKKNNKSTTKSKLVDAAKKATVLADYLRKQGIDAYEFHDRHESYVCVGGFDWLVQTDDRGVKRNNPGMVEVINKFKGATVNLPGRGSVVRSYQLPTKLAKAGIVCDLQPLPVLVPKATVQTVSRLFGR